MIVSDPRILSLCFTNITVVSSNSQNCVSVTHVHQCHFLDQENSLGRKVDLPWRRFTL